MNGRIKQKLVLSFDDLENEDNFDVIINCSGLGALKLAGDDSVFPIRGQVSRVLISKLYKLSIQIL